MARTKKVAPEAVAETPAAETPVVEEVAAAEETPAAEEAAAPAEAAAVPAEEPEAPKAEPKKRGRKPGSTNKPKTAEKAEAEFVVQFDGKDADVNAIEERVKAQFVAEGHRAGTIKSLKIYIKPEDYAAYYVINEKFSGRVDLF